MFSSFAPLLSLALLIPSISSTPIKRAGDVQCKNQFTGGFLVLSTIGSPNDSADNWIYAGLSEDTVKDSNGQQATYLTTKNANGQPFKREDARAKFDFYSCASDYMGYETVNEGKSTRYFGHLTPNVASPPAKHCLTFSSQNLNSTSHTLLVDSYCSFKDDESQTLNFWSYDTYYGAQAFVAAPKDAPAGDHYVTISDTGRVHFNPGKAPEGVTEYSFVPPH